MILSESNCYFVFTGMGATPWSINVSFLIEEQRH